MHHTGWKTDITNSICWLIWLNTKNLFLLYNEYEEKNNMDDIFIKEPRFLYEWDENKNQINIRKHGISFEETATAFEDPNALTLPDERHSFDEDRFWLLGFSHKANLLIVTHCFRDGQVIRINSARKAEKTEKLVYNIRGEL